MSKHGLAILVGGCLPSILFGISGVLQKTASRTGIAPGPYLLTIGLTTALLGAAITLILRDASITWRGAAHTAGFAALWSTGILAIVLALGRFDGPVSVIVPLYNMNTLVAVALGLIVLGERQEVNVGRLLAGAALIVAGGALAGTSVK